MKKLSSLIFSFICINIINILLCCPVTAQLLFQDDFQNSALSQKKWMLFKGNWRIANGALSQLSSTDRTIAIVSDDFWKEEWVDYTLEVTAAKIRGKNGVQIWWRIRDDFRAAVGRDGDSFVLDPPPEGRLKDVGLPRSKIWWDIGKEDKRSLVIRDIRGVVIEKNDTETNFSMGKEPLRVKIVNSAAGYKLYLNDKMLFEMGDITIKGGRIALGTEDTSAEFDNVLVYGPEGFAVEPHGKLTTNWGKLKAEGGGRKAE